MRQSKGFAIAAAFVGVMIFTVIAFSYSDFVALVRAQYGDYGENLPEVTSEEVSALFSEDSEIEVTEEQLETLSELTLVKAVISGAVSEELSTAVIATINQSPDIVGLAFTAGDADSDEVIASVADDDGSGIGLAANGEAVILIDDETSAVFPVEDVATNLLTVFEADVLEELGDDVALDELSEDDIADIIANSEPLVFAIEPDFLLEATMTDYDPETGMIKFSAVIFDADDNIVGEVIFTVVPVGEAEDGETQEYLIGIAPVPEETTE